MTLINSKILPQQFPMISILTVERPSWRPSKSRELKDYEERSEQVDLLGTPRSVVHC